MNWDTNWEGARDELDDMGCARRIGLTSWESAHDELRGRSWRVRTTNWDDEFGGVRAANWEGHTTNWEGARDELGRRVGRVCTTN